VAAPLWRQVRPSVATPGIRCQRAVLQLPASAPAAQLRLRAVAPPDRNRTGAHMLLGMFRQRGVRCVATYPLTFDVAQCIFQALELRRFITSDQVDVERSLQIALSP